MFQEYSINFLNLVVLQCDAMNIFSHGVLTGVLKNVFKKNLLVLKKNIFSPECRKIPRAVDKPMLKETLFIFSLAFLLHIETIFRNCIRGCITSISPKK